MLICIFSHKFHWILFLGVILGNGLAQGRLQAIVWTNDDKDNQSIMI